MDEVYNQNSTKIEAAWKFRKQSDVTSITASVISTPQNLFVVNEHEDLSEKSTIPVSAMEKLAFFRCYTSSNNKIEILCLQQNNVNSFFSYFFICSLRFFWFYISNVLCKSLPMIYVYVFFSTYSPDNYLYISKIMPICYGCNWVFILTAIFQLLVTMKHTSFYFIYAISGVIHKVPWNRCTNRTLYSPDKVFSFNCYELEEFSKHFNGTPTTYRGYFYSSLEENFTLSQIEYFETVISDATTFNLYDPKAYIVIFMWLLAICLYRKIFTNKIWKLLHYTHVALLVMLCVIFIHLVVTYENKFIQKIESAYDVDRTLLMNADFDLLAESMTAPPVVQILNSKSIEQVKPNLNSAVITTSNAIHYIFKALTSYLMEKYCENYVNATIIYWNYGSGSQFYFWPMYFATLFMGDLYILIFFGLIAVVEYCTCLIVYRCLIETIKNEWKWINPHYMGISIFIIAVTDHMVDTEMIAEHYFVFFTGVSTLAEAIVLFWMYPLSRLNDDITFNCGVPPTTVRVFSFWIVPIFYLIKICIMFNRLLTVGEEDSMFAGLNSPQAAFSIQFVLFTCGMAYSIYYYIYKEKKNWRQLFKPLPEWGPKNFARRQMRKHYDSQKFIASQAPRNISRHIISKSEFKTYKVDIQYDSGSRRSTILKEDIEVQ